eukprot:m.158639 g.158639  ORF g.158639 m.158639 type:complete len:61 (-) comp16469_c1_seq36:905-1087(-)
MAEVQAQLLPERSQNSDTYNCSYTMFRATKGCDWLRHALQQNPLDNAFVSSGTFETEYLQ